jgi:hypothetical protein
MSNTGIGFCYSSLRKVLYLEPSFSLMSILRNCPFSVCLGPRPHASDRNHLRHLLCVVLWGCLSFLTMVNTCFVSF